MHQESRERLKFKRHKEDHRCRGGEWEEAAGLYHVETVPGYIRPDK